MIAIDEKDLPDYIKLIFCNFLKPQEVICHRTGKRMNALVSDQLINSPETLLSIKTDLIKKIVRNGG